MCHSASLYINTVQRESQTRLFLVSNVPTFAMLHFYRSEGTAISNSHGTGPTLKGLQHRIFEEVLNFVQKSHLFLQNSKKTPTDVQYVGTYKLHLSAHYIAERYNFL